MHGVTWWQMTWGTAVFVYVVVAIAAVLDHGFWAGIFWGPRLVLMTIEEIKRS